jgi:RHS repeat-associated protein
MTETLHVWAGNCYRQTVRSRCETEGQATASVLSTSREQLSGLGAGGLAAVSQSIDPRGNVTCQSTVINRATRTVTTTTDTPDSDLNAVAITIDGKPSSSTTSTVSTPTVYNAYDALGRLTSVTSPRGVVATTAYDSATGRVANVTQVGNTTSYTYYPAGVPGAGKVATETLPDTKVIRTSYSLRGEVFRVWGGATYPLERIYDVFGQLQFLKTYRGGTDWAGATWPANPGTADTTEWIYEGHTGQLKWKTDAAGNSTGYAYHSNGKMAARRYARGAQTNYTWNSLGLLASTSYSDGTPAVTTQYDRASRPKTLVDAAGTHTYDYSVPLVINETIVGGILGGVSRSVIRDTYQRPSGISVTSSGATHATGYQYTSNSHLGMATTGIESATYGYLANSDAIQSLTYKSGTTPRLITTRNYDSSDRLNGVTNAYGTSQLQTYGVSEFDAMNRRKKITREDGTRWNYGYNDKGEVTSGIREKTATPNTAIPGWSHGYSFDEIGNRLASNTNGRASTYSPNKLNQITSRTIPRAFDVLGKAATTAAVTVNSQATTRLDEFFYKELPAGSGAVHVPYSVAATDATGTPTMRNGGKFLAATPENFLYDLDGNLTSDGRFTYTWDAENRLIAMQTLATVPVIAQRKLAFAYDAMGRRIRKTTWNGTATGTWLSQLELRFIHELGGWNILAEIAADSKFLRTYTWGTDLSGNRSGAGGVGGLLFTNLRASGKTFAHGMDLNGNVTLLVNTATGQAAATYDYGPFGEPIRQSGEYAKLNPYRFSTKYTDDETGLLDYGYRYYDPMTGRWPSRDPIGEEGGINLYGFAGNDGVNWIDLLGLEFKANQTEGSLAGGGLPNGWYGKTSRPTPTAKGDNEVVIECVEKNGSKTYKVHVKKSKEFDVTVDSFVANDQVGKVYTNAGLGAIKGHEQRRVDVYQKAYNTYLKVFESDIKSKCSKDGLNKLQAESYKSKLESWLSDKQSSATSKFSSWAKDQQTSITGENGRVFKNSEGLIDGINNPHTVGDPSAPDMACPK